MSGSRLRRLISDDSHTRRVITIRCTRSRGPRGFFCLRGVCRGPVNVAVIPLSGEPSINCEILTFELLAMDVINDWLNKTN